MRSAYLSFATQSSTLVTFLSHSSLVIESLYSRSAETNLLDELSCLCHSTANPIQKIETGQMPSQKGSKTTEREKDTFKEEIIHQFHIISENIIDQVKGVAEGVVTLNEKAKRYHEELKAENEATRAVLSQAITHVHQELSQAIINVNQKLDKTREELKTEIQESKQEVLAATKFSYAELDKRLTTLEKQFLDLKYRFEKIESHSAP